MTSIPLVLTSAHACSYLDDQQSQSIFVHPTYALDNWAYSQLIQQGFRRSGDEVYIPHCPLCAACLPVRLAVNEFKAHRSQQRCWTKNSQTKVWFKLNCFFEISQ